MAAFCARQVGIVSLSAVLFFFCALMVASGLTSLAADWSQEAGVNYAPPAFIGPTTVDAQSVRRNRRLQASMPK